MQSRPAGPFRTSLGLALALLVAACGSSAPSGTPVATDGGAPTTTPISVASEEAAMAVVRGRSPLFDGIERKNPDLIGQGSWWDAKAVEGGWRVTVEVGWGDCPAGCIDRHTWTWDVSPDGRTAFGGETGTPLADQVLAGLQNASRVQGLGGWAIAGPACPVERPGDPACAARMVEGAALSVKNAAGVEVARFTTDGSGLFRIPLAPGEYGVDAAPVEGLMGTPGPATVTVDEGNEAWLDVAYDTGIR